MMTTNIKAHFIAGLRFAFLCFATLPGVSAERATSPNLIEGRAIDATPIVLDESGICMEGQRRWGSSGLSLKIRIPGVSPVGRATDFYMWATQGPGRDMTTSMLLSEFDGKWAPPVYVTVWDLSDPESHVKMAVGFMNEKTGKATKIAFSNLALKSLLAINDKEDEDGRSLDDDNSTYRVGCRRWDSENSQRQATPPKSK